MMHHEQLVLLKTFGRTSGSKILRCLHLFHPRMFGLFCEDILGLSKGGPKLSEEDVQECQRRRVAWSICSAVTRNIGVQRDPT